MKDQSWEFRLHDKMDKAMEEISDLKVAIAKIPCKSHSTRLKIVELVVYGGVGLILIAFVASLSNGIKPINASQTKNPIEITGKIK